MQTLIQLNAYTKLMQKCINVFDEISSKIEFTVVIHIINHKIKNIKQGNYKLILKFWMKQILHVDI